MSMRNKEAVEFIKKLKDFCENKSSCGLCCFADDVDGHCLITDDIPCKLDVEVFVKQADELIE